MTKLQGEEILASLWIIISIMAYDSALKWVMYPAISIAVANIVSAFLCIRISLTKEDENE